MLKQLAVCGLNLGFYKLLYPDWMKVDFKALKVLIEGEDEKEYLFSSTE